MIDTFKRYFEYYFIILAIVELAFGQWYPEGRVIIKPLLLISLMVLYFVSTKKFDWLFLMALFFAFLGDTFLLSDDFFLIGLGSFLIMQLLYAYCFFRHRGQMAAHKLLGILIVAAMTGLMLYTIIPDLGGEFKVPVIVYSASLDLMAVSAIARRHHSDGYTWILFGVFFFLISDSLLGLGKFGGANELARLLVMPTYIIAQYLIVKGYLRYESSNNAPIRT